MKPEMEDTLEETHADTLKETQVDTLKRHRKIHSLRQSQTPSKRQIPDTLKETPSGTETNGYKPRVTDRDTERKTHQHNHTHNQTHRQKQTHRQTDKLTIRTIKTHRKYTSTDKDTHTPTSRHTDTHKQIVTLRHALFFIRTNLLEYRGSNLV